MPGGTFVFSEPTEAPTLDPQKSANVATHLAVAGVVYNKLIDYQTGPQIPYGSMDLKGDLAQSWERSPDAVTWTIHLRRGVPFQNIAPVNGREFTSADVACTMERIRTLPGLQLSQIDMVKSIATPDPYTVVFTLKEPYAAFDQNLASPYLSMLPCEGTSGAFSLSNMAIGTGPFILQKWNRTKEKVYVRNPTYFEPGKPYLDGFTVVVLGDPAAALAAFRTGEIDRTATAEASLLTATNSNPDTVVTRELSTSDGGMLFANQLVEPFANPDVRTAMAMAIDRAGMAEALNGRGFELSGPIPALLDGSLSSDESQQRIPFDPDQAKKLLERAGYPRGFSMTMMTSDDWGPALLDRAQWVQQDLKKVGINVTIKLLDLAAFYDAARTGNYQLGFGYLTGMFTPDDYLHSLYRTDALRNWFNGGDGTLDQMIAKSRGILDPAKRTQALKDISLYIATHGPNPVMSYNGCTIYLSKPYVHGLYAHPQYARPWLKDVWLDAAAPVRS